ncbi:MAG: M48 family metalloprotease [Pseudomonadales bacterium]
MSQIRHAASLFVLLLCISACGVNPVTGERELQWISTAQEINIGKQNYLPARQVQGGDYVVDRDVTRYVEGVMLRVAAASEKVNVDQNRKLPYEIEVLNSSVPNAWAMPGGKMAINRGLLTELNSEAELAAVLGHEIVHAAARHGAKSQERGMLLQGGLLATQIASASNRYGNLIAGGAMVGAQLVTTKYGRSAELQSDLYGMQYMVAAGYNPQAAVDLQQTFVRLSEGRQSNWLDGLFASHPPSAERVARNRETAARLGGSDLEYGKESYKRAISTLLRDADAYAAHDKALKAAKEKDLKTAYAEVEKAIRLQPREPKFYGLKGDLAAGDKKFKTAITQYDKAINLYPEYFAFHLHKGYAKQELGDKRGAKSSFEKSNSILPTPNAQKALGDLALAGGDRETALKYFSSAARSNSPVGQQALSSMTRLELPSNPSKYIKTQLGLSNDNKVLIQVLNQAPVSVRDIQIITAYFDANGNQVSRTQTLRVGKALKPGERTVITTRISDTSGLKAQVSKASVAE